MLDLLTIKEAFEGISRNQHSASKPDAWKLSGPDPPMNSRLRDPVGLGEFTNGLEVLSGSAIVVLHDDRTLVAPNEV